ncbi:MAG: hypothetical protein AAF846_30105 [Chloroflexota bacterium]
MGKRLDKFIVHWQSIPAPGIGFYRGRKTIYAEDVEDAKRECLRELTTGAFRDRSPSMFRITKVERV